MTLSRVRNVVLALGLASLVGGVVMTFTEEHHDTEITIGEHTTRTLGGLTFNLDTIISTLVAAGAVLLLGFLARRALTKDPDDHVPTKLPAALGVDRR